MPEEKEKKQALIQFYTLFTKLYDGWTETKKAIDYNAFRRIFGGKNEKKGEKIEKKKGAIKKKKGDRKEGKSEGGSKDAEAKTNQGSGYARSLPK